MKTKAFSISSIQVKRCTWTKEEDQLLLNMVQGGEPIDWNVVANALTPLKPQNNPPKNSKQCRERWHNRLDPTIKQSPWTDEEVALFFKLYQCHGPKWSKLACEIQGRTDNTIKNFFYCRLRKVARQIKKGIIPEVMKESAREVEYNIYLMNYLRSYYTQSRSSAHLVTDKYISDMIRSTGVTYEMIGRFLKEYKRATRCVFHGSDTDDSFTKLPGTDVFHLPVPPRTKEDDANSIKTVSYTHLTLPTICSV
eukprot:TRINITY_DN6031_c0_g1_i6.p1 TRINITY_DN6031_c0_g1~~TRINITY_DN6031_c0_g1_i6.p1  ORF type:complete len:252 (-),score=43.54 TRINITY_DN6031_c0_g1_i6:45-800(-)